MKTSPNILSLKVDLPFLSSEEVVVWNRRTELLDFLTANTSPRVLILPADQETLAPNFLQSLSAANPDCVWIFDKDLEPKFKFASAFPQFIGTLSSDEKTNRELVDISLERISELNQESDLLSLLKSEQHKLQGTLKKLSESKKKKNTGSVSKAHLRMKTLENSLLEILKAKSIPEVEKALKKSLSKLLPLDYARVVFNQQSSLAARTPDSYLIKIPLFISQSKTKGWLILGLTQKKNVTEKDLDLLEELAEIASLSMNRILQLEASEGLKQQWDATFDAISDPLCLVDEDMTILRTNQAFATAVSKKFGALIGENALKIFFKNNPEVWRTSPPFNLKIQVQNKLDGKSYSLVVHDLKFEMNGKNINLLLIKDITEQMRLEKHIREKSKLVELGTIGSSIAHELNNPLAGMLSYLQLLLMDAEKGSSFFEDLKEMESATLRCRDIVQNLLGFSRKQSEQKTEVDLNKLIGKAVQLVELKSRFKKVEISVEAANESTLFLGDQNSLVQALTHILTNSVEALEETLLKKADVAARINIVLSQTENLYIIKITDNGPGILEKHLPLVINPLFTTKKDTHHAGLGLTVAYSIFAEHSGTLEIESRPGQGVVAIISLPRPELDGSSRGIDTQI